MPSVNQMIESLTNLAKQGFGESEVYVVQQYPYRIGFKYEIINGRLPVEPKGEKIKEIRFDQEQLEDAELHSTTKPPIFIIGDGDPLNRPEVPKNRVNGALLP